MKQIRYRFDRLVLVRKTLLALGAIVLPIAISACGKSEWREVAPNTGTAAAEAKTGDVTPTNVQPGETVYTVPPRLRTRENPNQDPATSTRVLEQNTPVQVVDPNPVGDEKLVRVRPVPVAAVPAQKTTAAPAAQTANAPAPKAQAAKVAKPAPVYVPAKYLNRSPIVATQAELNANRYIVIQNLATNKLRVYEVAEKNGEPNILIMETDMITGEANPGVTKRAAVGSFKIEQWVKFYQDYAELSAPWYSPDLAKPPLPGASLSDWMQPHVLPQNADGKSKAIIRGAFGWYTAKIGPNAFAQWTHGTIGWGADRDRFITKLSKWDIAQFYADPRHYGCTRVENRAIALMHSILPVGTRLIKVYAREEIADPTLKNYDSKKKVFNFAWALTSDEVRKTKPRTSDSLDQLVAAEGKLDESKILENGVYEADATPTAVEFRRAYKTTSMHYQTEIERITPEANSYDLKESEFRGIFLVDEGRFEKYQHPKSLRLGGFADGQLPNAVIKIPAIVEAKGAAQTAPNKPATKKPVQPKTTQSNKATSAAAPKTAASAPAAQASAPAPTASASKAAASSAKPSTSTPKATTSAPVAPAAPKAAASAAAATSKK